eukprot:gene8236-11146_t
MSRSRFNPSSTTPLLLNLNNRKSPSTKFDTIVIPKDYSVAIGAVALSIAFAGLHQYFVAIPIGLIGLFIGRQTGKVRFVFDDEALEVLVAKDGSDDKLVQTRENFAVGGRNRWTYKSITNWFFIPSNQVPILMYFNENQTNKEEGKGQLHLFPVIMKGDVLYDTMTERIGSK